MILPVADPTLASIIPPAATEMLNLMESRLVISILLYAVQSPSLIPLIEAAPNLAEVINPLAASSYLAASYSFVLPSLLTVVKPTTERKSVFLSELPPAL
jgi:hypothetical protein